MKLYHYAHCPFCVRIRMVLGYLNIPFESVVLPYNDEKTPISLMGKKMLPIFDLNGSLMNESLDIIQKLDTANKLNTIEAIKSYQEMELLLSQIGSDVHSLAMPYWIWSPEFDSESRQYFQKKKEAKRGPFANLVKNKEGFLKGITNTLKSLEERLTPFYTSKEITLNDILIASHLWGLYIVPEFQFSEKTHNYLQAIKQKCHFNYHEDFWREK